MKKPALRLSRRAIRGAIAGLVSAAVVGTGIALTTTHTASADPADSFNTTTPIKHVVVIYDENESFDHYFGTYPHATNTDGVHFTATAGTPTPKNLVSDNVIKNNPNSTKPFRYTSAQASTCDQSHSYTPEQQAMNWSGGKAKMNLFPEKTARTCTTSGLYHRSGMTMGYFDGNTVTGLWNYAQNFTLSDNNWASTFGPSTPGALEVVAGQTWGAKAYDSTSNDENPAPAASKAASGLVQVDTTTGIGTLIADPDPAYDDCSNNDHTSSSNVVGMQGKNIGDLLDAKGVSWGWFQGGFTPTTPYGGAGSYAQCGSSHANTAGNAVRDYSPHHNPFAYYKSTANPHHDAPASVNDIGKSGDAANHNYDLTDFSAALSAGNLPAVSYLKASAYQDAHPGNSDPLGEQHFLVDEINQIQASPEWASTAIIVAYDDSDGWYDHVAPKITNSSNTSDDAAICKAAASAGVGRLGGHQARCGPSQRLPLLVISPFARKNYIDHTMISQASIVKFVEDNWGLGSLGGGSFDATAGNMKFLFDFQHPQQRSIQLNDNGQVTSASAVSVPAAGGHATSLHASTTATYGKPTLAITASSAGDVSGGVITSTIDGKGGPSLPMYSSHGTLRLPTKLARGRHTVKLTFNGSANAKPVTVAVSVTVVKGSVGLHTKAHKAKHGKVQITVTVTQKGSSLKPVGTILGRIGHKHVKARVRNGVAHVKVKVRKHQRVKVKLTFKGPNYKNKTKTSRVRG